ncbi:8232_t:CDS:1, partial [Rhizophagus irregularis]
ENDISMAIDIASKQTDSFSSLDDDVPELDIKDFAKQVDLVKITQSTYHF